MAKRLKYMHIGIDFDNTIVDYSDILHLYAVRLGLISSRTEKNKQVIRDKIKKGKDGNERWTELQGLIYGDYINQAKPAKGILSFLDYCKMHAIKVSIISHKPKFPAYGKKIDMQQSAKGWLRLNNFYSHFDLSKKDIFFGKTRDEKIDQIKKRHCTHFIDDLKDVFYESNFPEKVVKILYTSRNVAALKSNIIICKDWFCIKKYFSNYF